MSSDEDPRATYKKEVIARLQTSGFSLDVLGAVEKALDNPTLDRLFTTASSALTVSSPPMALRSSEWYYGDAATAFAAREKREGGVVVQGSVHGVVAAGGISGGDINVAGNQWDVSAVSLARLLVQDMRSHSMDTGEGERLLANLEAAPAQEKSSAFSDFTAWAKKHAGDLASNGLALLSMLLALVK